MTLLGDVGEPSMKAQLGVWNVLPDEHSTFQLTEYFDFIYIDLEHGFRSIDDLLTTIRLYNIKQINFSVRVRSFDDPLIQTLLDVGVRRFVLPQIRTIHELEIFKQKISFPQSDVGGSTPDLTWKLSGPLSKIFRLL